MTLTLLLLSCVLSWFITQQVLNRAHRIRLLHAPNHRSMHTQKLLTVVVLVLSLA